jgi:hypothetical protein
VLHDLIFETPRPAGANNAMTFRPFRTWPRLGALLRALGGKLLPLARCDSTPALRDPPAPPASDIGRRLQERWRETGREPGVLLALNGDVLVVCADGIRSRVGGVWRSGQLFTATQMRAMRRPATRLDWLRLQNEARQHLPPVNGARDYGRSDSALKAIGELPHGIVRRAANGNIYVRTFNFAASLVRGRWHVGNRFTYEERQAMAYVHDRAEREMIVTIARAALGVPRTDATFV